MSNDIWGMCGKKKSLTIPSKQAPVPTQQVAQPAPTQQVAQPAPAPQPVKAKKPKKVKAKVKPVKVTAQQTQQQSTHQPQYQLSDFRLQTTVDNIGIRITTLYLNTPIHQFILPAAQYANWQRANPQIKYNYVQARTLANTFFGDMGLVQMVIQATINAVDDLFMRARQAQAQKRIRSEGDD